MGALYHEPRLPLAKQRAIQCPEICIDRHVNCEERAAQLARRGDKKHRGGGHGT